MPILGAGVLALIAIAISTSFTGSVPVPQAVVTVTASQKVERPQFQYKHFPAPVLPPVVSRVEEVRTIIAAPAPRPMIEQVVEVQVVPVPTTDPAIAACLGKLVGALCSVTNDGVEKEGTCLTPSWSPVTCVPHTQ